MQKEMDKPYSVEPQNFVALRKKYMSVSEDLLQPQSYNNGVMV